MPLLIKPDKQVLLFIHIPKTGGTSIKSNLNDGIQIAFNYEFKEELPCPPQHFHSGMLERLGVEKLANQSFAITRHPVDRFISEFTYRKKVDWKFKNLDLLTFSLFCKKIYPKNNYIFSNHVRPQSDFIMPTTKFFKIENGMDKVYNTYPEFFHKDGNISPRKNVSKSDSEYIDRFTLKILKELYESDFSKFDYEFDSHKAIIREVSAFKYIRSQFLSSIIAIFYYLSR